MSLCCGCYGDEASESCDLRTLHHGGYHGYWLPPDSDSFTETGLSDLFCGTWFTTWTFLLVATSDSVPESLDLPWTGPGLTSDDSRLWLMTWNLKQHQVDWTQMTGLGHVLYDWRFHRLCTWFKWLSTGAVGLSLDLDSDSSLTDERNKNVSWCCEEVKVFWLMGTWAAQRVVSGVNPCLVLWLWFCLQYMFWFCFRSS